MASPTRALQRLERLVGHVSPCPRAAPVLATHGLGAHAQPTSATTSPAPLGQTPRKLIIQEVRGRVGLIRLNRPKALNALNDELMAEVGAAVKEYESSGVIGCIVLTGEGKAFAAGADIKEMSGKSYYEMSTRDKIEPWEILSKCKVPIIAAVNGFAFGGGCEIAMMCDIIYASENALFGQPEILIGTIPGAGGTQRLSSAIGKSKAMEMVLSGRQMKASDMERAGLVSKVLPLEKLLPEALALAEQIASLSLPIVKLAKQSVLASFEAGSLNTGMRMERALFQSTFALADQKVGMQAFVLKKKPEWTHQ